MSPLRISALLLAFIACGRVSAAPDPNSLREKWLTGGKVDIQWSTAVGGHMGAITIAGEYMLVGANNGIKAPDEHYAKWHRILPPGSAASPYTNTVTCLDIKTGALRWRAVHPQLADHSKGIPIFPVTSRPAVAGDRVYYLTVAWELVCADFEGFYDKENDGPFTDETHKDSTDADIVWKIDLQKDLGIAPRTAGDIGYIQSSPLVIGDLVYLVTGNGADNTGNIPHPVPAPDAPSFIAVERHTGKVAWSSNAPGKNIVWMQGGSPVSMPERGEVVFPGGDGCLYGFDAKSGEQHWKADLNAIGGTKELFFECTPLVTNGLVIASLRHCIEMGPVGGAPLIAVKPGKPGEPVQTAWMFGKDRGGFSPHMILQGGLLHALSFPAERTDTHRVHALDPATGREKWTLVVGDKNTDNLDLAGDGRLFYCPNDEGELFVVQPDPAAPRVLRMLECADSGFSPFCRIVSCDTGLCLPVYDGLLMVRLGHDFILPLLSPVNMRAWPLPLTVLMLLP